MNIKLNEQYLKSYVEENDIKQFTEAAGLEKSEVV